MGWNWRGARWRERVRGAAAGGTLVGVGRHPSSWSLNEVAEYHDQSKMSRSFCDLFMPKRDLGTKIKIAYSMILYTGP